MNYPLSEIVSWVLEPVASYIQGSSELISCEDLKSQIDEVNSKNKDWTPKAEEVSNLSKRAEMVVSNNPPKLCDCLHGQCDYDDCLDDSAWEKSNESKQVKSG